MRAAIHTAPAVRAVSAQPVYAGGLVSGLLLSASTAQLGLGLLAFVALVPLLAAIDARPRAGAAFGAGWVCGTIFFACALMWIPLAGYGGLLLGLAALYVLALGLSHALLAALLARLRRRSRALFLAATPVLWIGVELARSQGALGYPWHHLGYALADHAALIQLAAFGGLYALSLWIAAVNVGLVAARGASPRVRLAGGALLAAPLVLGLRALGPGGGADTLRIAAAQPEIAAPGHAAPQRFDANLRVLLDLTEEAVRGKPDLLIWPESAFERPVPPAGDPFLGGVAHHYATPLLTGAWRVEPGTPPALLNSAVLARPDGEVELVGDKVHPVPFYEGRAETRFERLLARLTEWPGQFHSGERPGMAQLDRPGRSSVPLGVLICLDSSYPGLARDLRHRGARLLIEISNEAQTGAWSAEQHALVSRLRAVETGLPLVRVGNIGPTEWIDARGRVIERIRPGSAAAVAATIALADRRPPYTRLGDGPAFVFGLLPLLALIRRRGEECTPPAPAESRPNHARSCKETNPWRP